MNKATTRDKNLARINFEAGYIKGRKDMQKEIFSDPDSEAVVLLKEIRRDYKVRAIMDDPEAKTFVIRINKLLNKFKD